MSKNDSHIWQLFTENDMWKCWRKTVCWICCECYGTKGHKGQHGDQAYLKELLAKVGAEEGENELTKKDAEFLCSYCIHDPPRFSESEAKQLSEDPNTLFLFASKIPRDNHNDKMLFEKHSKSNPVAIMKPKYTDPRGKQIGYFTSENMTPDRILNIGKVQTINISKGLSWDTKGFVS